MKKLLLAGVCLLFATGANALDVWSDNTIKNCFNRVYDRDHLARHFDQTVTAIRFKYGKAQDKRLSMPLEYDLQVKFRGSNTVYKTTGQCQHKKNGIECETSDGHEPSSGIFVVTKGDYILFYVKEFIGVWQDGVEENEHTVRPFEAGKDDDVFRMNKSACWK